MTTTEALIIAFCLLAAATLLPLSSEIRAALIIALIILAALTLLGGGMDLVMGYF
jgi:hypothetical protein